MHLSFIQYRNLEIACNLKVTILKSFETWISYSKDPEVVRAKSLRWIDQKL